MIRLRFLLQGYAHGVEDFWQVGQGMLIGFATLYGLFLDSGIGWPGT